MRTVGLGAINKLLSGGALEKKYRYLTILLIFIGCAASFFWYLAALHIYQPSSDGVQPILQAQDILRGNIFLSGWHLPLDSFYFTEMPPYLIWLSIFGEKSLTCFSVIPALEYELIIVLAIFFSTQSLQFNYRNILSISLVFLLIGSPPVVSPQLTPDFHILGIAYSLISLALLVKIKEKNNFKKSRFIVFAFLVLSALTIFSDPMVVAYNYAPIIVVLGIEFLVGEDWRTNLKLLVLVLFSIVSGLLVAWILKLLGGFATLPNSTTAVAPANMIPSTITAVIFGFLYISASYCFGLTFVSIPAIRAVVWVYGIFFSVKNQKLFQKKQDASSFLDNCLLASVAFTFLYCILSNNFSTTILTNPFNGGTGTRYLLPSVIYSGILLARNSGSFLFKLPTNRFRFLLVLFLFLSASASLLRSVEYAFHFLKSKAGDTHNPYVEASNWLISQNLTCGIGEYWSAPVMSYASKGQVVVRSVLPSADGTVEPNFFLYMKKWYDGDTYPSFYIQHSEMSTPNLEKTYGKPKEIKTIDGLTIFVFSPEAKGKGMKLDCKD